MNKLLTTKEASQILGIAEGALATLRYRRQGPSFIRVGHKSIRYSEEDIAAYIEACRTETQGSGVSHD